MATNNWIRFDDSTTVRDLIESFADVLHDMGITLWAKEGDYMNGTIELEKREEE